MGPFKRNLFGRTDVRTDECKSIVPPKFLGRSKKALIKWLLDWVIEKNLYLEDENSQKSRKTRYSSISSERSDI